MIYERLGTLSGIRTVVGSWAGRIAGISMIMMFCALATGLLQLGYARSAGGYSVYYNFSYTFLYIAFYRNITLLSQAIHSTKTSHSC